VRRVAAVVLALAAVVGCSGTFTPPVPTLYLVFLDASETQPARVALLDFVVTPTERRLELLTAVAYAFPPGERLVAVDVRDRERRLEAWVLTAAGDASRAVRLHRIDLRSVPETPGTTLAPAADPLTLTDAAGAWVGFDDPSAVPSGCLSNLVAAAAGDALALWDAGTGGRCGAVTDAPDARVHVLDLDLSTVRRTVDDVGAPGVSAGDPADAAALLLVRRPPGGSGLDTLEVVPVTFAEARPDLGARGTEVPGLLDVAGLPGGLAALRRLDAASGREIVVVSGATTAQRAAVDGATQLHVDATGRLATLLTTGGGRVGVTYPGEDAARTIAFDARAVTLEPLNAYAVAVRAAGGLCVVDLLVPSTAATCDLPVPAELVGELPAPRFVTWAFAEPAAP